jgi:hypothetical protein
MVHYNHLFVSLKYLARRLVMSAPPDLDAFGIFDDFGTQAICDQRVTEWERQLVWALDVPTLWVTKIIHCKQSDSWQHEYVAIHVSFTNPENEHLHTRVVYVDRDFEDRTETTAGEDEVLHWFDPMFKNLLLSPLGIRYHWLRAM